LAPSLERDTAWAMSEENVEIIRRGYELYAAGDLERVAALFSPSAELPDAGGLGIADTTPGTRSGPDGFLRATEEARDAFEDFRVEPEEFIDAGERVVVPVLISGRGRASGAKQEVLPCARVGAPQRQGDPKRDLPDRRGSPRSRKTLGVGDVAGERRLAIYAVEAINRGDA